MNALNIVKEERIILNISTCELITGNFKNDHLLIIERRWREGMIDKNKGEGRKYRCRLGFSYVLNVLFDHQLPNSAFKVFVQALCVCVMN